MELDIVSLMEEFIEDTRLGRGWCWAYAMCKVGESALKSIGEEWYVVHIVIGYLEC